jgi:hypothetical protein
MSIFANYTRDAFVLGAGFSIAIARTMPSTDVLGDRVLSSQRSIHAGSAERHSSKCDGLSCDYPVLGADGVPKPTFELWLSTLAEPQPHLFEPENDRRRALFGELSGLIALNVERAVQLTVKEGGPPEWLNKLVTHWNNTRADVITFNYDTLIEATVDSLDLLAPYPPKGDAIPLKSKMLGPSVVPSFRTVLEGPRVPPADSFWYRKLHGSTHWYWDDTTRSAESIVQVGVRYHWNDEFPVYNDFELRDYIAPGKVPLIVPPTTGKSSYFENPIIRFLWRDAFAALAAAPRVFVIGYSLPQADLLVRSLLGMALGDSDVWLVNPDAQVADRFSELGVGTLHTEFCGSPVDMNDVVSFCVDLWMNA